MKLNSFFDIIIGMLADDTLSKQHDPKPMGFSFQERKFIKKDKINESIAPRFKKLANIKK